MGNGIHTGEGRCSLRAAIFSPGDSNVTTGIPKVMPIRLARAPPSECPINQMLELGLDAKIVKAVRWSRKTIH